MSAANAYPKPSFNKKEKLNMPGSTDSVSSSDLPGPSLEGCLAVYSAHSRAASNVLGLVVTLCFNFYLHNALHFINTR